MRKAILVYNPLSGARFIVNKLGYIFDKFQSIGVLVQPYILEFDKTHELLYTLKNEEYEFIMAAGGDGTINYVANVLMQSGLNIPLGVIPAGTCNDFATCIGVSASFDTNIDVILKGKIKHVDIGLLNKEKYFLNTYAGGAFADISFKTDNELKKNLGAFAYYIKALSEVANIRSFKLTINTDEGEIKEDAILFFITNGKNIGGFTNIVKKASITDGMMDIVVLKECSHIDLIGLFFKVLNGTIDDNPNVKIFRFKKCFISANREIVSTVDGEKGDSLPVVVEFINKGLKVFVP
ncbi:MAG: YegS/Rv2252/BmrU family lipid kinase [Clostridiales bacterium]|nr:YegS/Rv2252/BmrU family lipid kinase [Clostridiales bacterium]